MTAVRTAVIVGASVAGARAAQALRTEGFDGRIVLVGDEPEVPYDKPPLSKQYLAGAYDTTRLSLLSHAVAAEAGIELVLGAAAESIDVAGRRVALAGGQVIAYDTCVIATGASARPSPWAATSGVHVVRTRTDSEDLRTALGRGGTVLVVGGGFIGAEVAATAVAMGCDVTIVDPLPVPMARVVGEEIGGILAAVHQRHGVTTHFGAGVASIEGAAGHLDVRLTDGTRLQAATAVVGIGAVPNDSWLASSGLLVDNGLVCDEYCRAVDVPDVFAAGDVARWMHPRHGEPTRVEHWTNAVEQAACVAHNIAHPNDLRPYEPVQYVWSDQYDWKIQIVGRPATAERLQLVGDPGSGSGRFAALYGADGGRFEGAVTVNWPRALVDCRRLAAAGADLAAAVEAVERLAPARR